MSESPESPPSIATFRAPDGSPVAYRAFRARDPRATVLMIHGWSDHLGRWSWPAEQLREARYTVFLVDLRGHGRSAGRRGHIERFSQYVADIHAFRREVISEADRPHVLLGHSFGGALVLRYLQIDPDLPVEAAILSNPFLGLAFSPPIWKVVLAKLLAHVGSSLAIPANIQSDHLSRDPAVGRAFAGDPLVHRRMTPGAWREIQALQRIIARGRNQIAVPLLFLVSGQDRLVDAGKTLEFARGLAGDVTIRQYPDMFHECLNDPERHLVMDDIHEYLCRVSEDWDSSPSGS